MDLLNARTDLCCFATMELGLWRMIRGSYARVVGSRSRGLLTDDAAINFLTAGACGDLPPISLKSSEKRGKTKAVDIF